MKEVQKDEVTGVSGGVQLPNDPVGGVAYPQPIVPDFPQVPCFPVIGDPTTSRSKL